ncbi:hypothetical protein, partial [Cyanobium sp. Copco_Reservoir_LC18]|uniref:hypothetical protein n=1 Tax=Cyanobium sp. Copco_Reservoir_LC18 TaxID=1328305 RepID=UPI001F39A09F
MFASLLLGNPLTTAQRTSLLADDDTIQIILSNHRLLAAEASSDTSAPQITSAALSATSVDLSQPGAGGIRLTLGVSDAISGFDIGFINFTSS